ncbi:MAG: hypothetical protein LC745_03135, partial [Planctomycetia bacterium]|nr:hypothetical protein [Planctomycetia bacterium]
MRNSSTVRGAAGIPGFALACFIALTATDPTRADERPARGAPVPRLPKDNLLVYRGAAGEPLPVRGVDDWLKRRGEILASVQAVMGRFPGPERRCPLDVKVEQEVDCGSYVRRLLTYASEPGSRVPAYLLIPKAVLKGDGTRARGVLC